MLDLAIDARRGNFHLQIECRLAAPWTVVFGPSGSGKSTLLRLLAGLDRGSHVAHARIAHDSRTLTDLRRNLWLHPGHRHTALVAQQPALFPHLSVAANIAYGLHALDRAARAHRVQQMLDLVGAPELIHRRTQGLSGGQAQRIALARALAPGPCLLLLDEPFSALDGAASDALLERLQAWVSDNRVQTIMATHEAADAFAIGAEVTLLREGRLVAHGPADQVLAAEKQRIARRLGSG